VLEEAIDGRIELILPGLVLDELRRVLVEKLGFGEEQAYAARELLADLATKRPGKPERIDAVTGDEDDDAIVASAVDAHTDFLVTGDRKHLLPLREHQGIRLLTPQALLAELQAGEP
jgi:predicted nucleic acid-binding protein